MSLIPVEYQGERILTTEQLAQIYETEVKNISNNFNRNPEKFIEGKHYHRLEGEDLRIFKGIHQNDESLKFVSKNQVIRKAVRNLIGNTMKGRCVINE